jgi:hypothetical protein
LHVITALIYVLKKGAGIPEGVVTDVFSADFNYPHKPTFSSMVGMVIVPHIESNSPYMRLAPICRLDMVASIEPNREKALQKLSRQRFFRQRADQYVHTHIHSMEYLTNMDKRELRDLKKQEELKRKREEQEVSQRKMAEAAEAERRRKRLARERTKAGQQV